MLLFYKAPGCSIMQSGLKIKVINKLNIHTQWYCNDLGQLWVIKWTNELPLINLFALGLFTKMSVPLAHHWNGRVCWYIIVKNGFVEIHYYAARFPCPFGESSFGFDCHLKSICQFICVKHVVKMCFLALHPAKESAAPIHTDILIFISSAGAISSPLPRILFCAIQPRVESISNALSVKILRLRNDSPTTIRAP